MAEQDSANKKYYDLLLQTSLGKAIHAAANKVTPVDADEFPIADSADGFKLKHVTWSNIKAAFTAAFTAFLTTVNGIVYWDGVKLINSPNATFDGTTATIAGNGALPSLRVGTFEHETVATNNAMLMNNGYFDATNFRYRANGFFNIIQFTAGGWSFATSPSGTAGNIATATPQFTLANTGAASFAQSIAATTNIMAGGNITATGLLAGSNLATPMTTNAFVYWDGSKLTTSANGLFDGASARILTGAGTLPELRVGSLEFETNSVNNTFIFDNGYFDGTNFKYRANGFFNVIQYTAGGWAFITGPSGSAGTTVGYTPWFTISNVGQGYFAASGTPTDSQLRIGSAEIETISIDNSILCSNGYYNGTNFIYRNAGYFGAWQFFNGGVRFVNDNGTTGGAGTVVPFAINFSIDTAGNTTATKFIGPATAIKSATTSVDMSASPAPSVGQVPTATSPTTATWQTLGSTILKANTTSDFSTVTTTLTNVTALTVTLAAGSTYQVIFTGISNSTGSGLGKLDFNGGSATVTGIAGNWVFTDDNTPGSLRGGIINALNSSVNGGSATFEAGVTVTFTIKVNAGGTMIVRYAQNILDAGNVSKLMAYASLTAIPIA